MTIDTDTLSSPMAADYLPGPWPKRCVGAIREKKKFRSTGHTARIRPRSFGLGFIFHWVSYAYQAFE